MIVSVTLLVSLRLGLYGRLEFDIFRLELADFFSELNAISVGFLPDHSWVLGVDIRVQVREIQLGHFAAPPGQCCEMHLSGYLYYSCRLAV